MFVKVWPSHFQHYQIPVNDLFPIVLAVVITQKSKLLLRIAWFWLFCFDPLVFLFPNIVLAFQSSDFENTWWRLFQKHVVCATLDIYVFIISVWNSSSCWSNKQSCKDKYIMIWIRMSVLSALKHFKPGILLENIMLFVTSYLLYTFRKPVWQLSGFSKPKIQFHIIFWTFMRTDCPHIAKSTIIPRYT